MTDFKKIIHLMEDLRVGVVLYESEICNRIQEILVAGGIKFQREVRIGQRSRVDFLTDSGIAIEVKKGKPNSSKVSAQVTRYAESEKVTGVVLISERGLWSHVESANGKPVGYVSLSKNWGISL